MVSGGWTTADHHLIFRGEHLNSQAIDRNYTVGNGDRVQVIFRLLPFE